MERAVAAYVDACAAHAATLAAAWIALAAGPSPDGARVDAGGPGGVAVGGRVYARTRVRRWLRLAAEVALRQRYPRPPVEPDKA
jgi:hypothetical protein